MPFFKLFPKRAWVKTFSFFITFSKAHLILPKKIHKQSKKLTKKSIFTFVKKLFLKKIAFTVNNDYPFYTDLENKPDVWTPNFDEQSNKTEQKKCIPRFNLVTMPLLIWILHQVYLQLTQIWQMESAIFENWWVQLHSLHLL